MEHDLFRPDIADASEEEEEEEEEGIFLPAPLRRPPLAGPCRPLERRRKQVIQHDM